MIPRIVTAILLCALASIVISTPQNAYTQNAQPQTLDDIFNPDKDYNNNDKPLTPKFMANYYYRNCMKSENITMSESEKELLCTCTAAKASQILLVDEFKVMTQKTKAGKHAHGKFIAYAYVPCMPFVMKDVFKGDCKNSKLIQDIRIGKSAICNCASDIFQDYLNVNEVTILDLVLREHPMTLNPLEYYLRGAAYYAQRDVGINQCKYKFLYNRDN